MLDQRRLVSRGSIYGHNMVPHLRVQYSWEHEFLYLHQTVYPYAMKNDNLIGNAMHSPNFRWRRWKTRYQHKDCSLSSMFPDQPNF